jgi:hypothetical protein
MTFNEWWQENGHQYSSDALHMSEKHMASVVWDAATAAVLSSAEGDAKRFLWLLQGNGFFMEENCLCGPGTDHDDSGEQDRARKAIDKAMRSNEIKA